MSLSSGIDSTLIASLTKKHFPEKKIHAVSVTFSDSYDESPLAEKTAEKLDINHNVVYVENFLEELPQMISIVKKPFWDLHWYHITKKAKSLSNYFISGDGGDELFGGYTFRYKKYFSIINKNSTVNEKIKAYLSCHERDWVPDQEQIFTKKINFNWNEIHSLLFSSFDNKLSLLDQVFLADYNGKLLYNMSPLYEKFHNHFKLFYLAPLLNPHLLKLSSQLPEDKKYNSSTDTGKLPLLELCEKLNIRNLISTKKQGFSVDTKNLWKNSGKNLCDYYLSDGRTISDRWINHDWVKKYLKKDNLDVRYVNKFLGLLAFEIWYRIFITNEMKPNEKLNFN